MREAKERLNRTRNTRNIAQALKNMDTSEVMNTFDDLLFKVKSKIASVEARLDVAMDNLSTHGESTANELERDEELNREKAKETLRQVKIEMGMLYSEIEKHADNMRVEKTIGSGDEPDDESMPAGNETNQNEGKS